MARKDREDPANGLAQLKAQLKAKQPERLYVFYGEEPFLLNHYRNQLKKLLLDPLTESFNFHRFNSETFSLAELSAAVENLPMMAESTLIQVDDIDLFKLPEADREHMAQILADLPAYCTLVFCYDTVAWSPDKRMKKLWQALSENGLVVNFAKQDQRDLIAWVSRHFAARKKRISNELCAYLIEITGGTMTALNGEIEKICAYSGAGEIVRADIDAVTEPVMEAVVFQMTDLLGEGSYGKALEKLNQLFKMQQEPLSILGAIGAHFRRIAAARLLLENGKTATELMRLYGLRDYPARKTMEMARRFSARFCRAAAEQILLTDYQIKNSYDDSSRLLELLILNLAREARNG